MKIKAILLTIILTASLLHAAPQQQERLTRAEYNAAMKTLRDNIAKEQGELKRLTREANALNKGVARLQEVVDSHNAVIRSMTAAVQEADARLVALQRDKAIAQQTIAALKRDIARSSIYVMENMDFTPIKVLMFAEEYSTAVASMEVLDKTHRKMLTRIDVLSSAVEREKALEEEIVENRKETAKLLQERTVVMREYAAEKEKYENQLALRMKEQKGAAEYVSMLNDRQKELEKQFQNAIRTNKVANPAPQQTKQPEGKTVTFRTAEKTRVSSPPPVTGFGLLKGTLPWPMDGEIIERFGMKRVEGTGKDIPVKGIKIASGGDGVVKAVADGTVIYHDVMRGQQNIVIVQHDTMHYSIYSHMDTVSVNVKDSVRQGSSIGRIAVDQQDNSAYLYFEIRQRSSAQDPMTWLSAQRRK